ncbi:MAG: TetR family transcriptional regulator C-terminal domain-containing protein [Flavicella sp.]
MDDTLKIDENTFISKYMDDVLMTGEKPVSVYRFTKELETDEAEFHKYFGSFAHLEKRIFVLFFENSLEMLQKNEEYENYDTKNKLLSLYYTMFEMMTANRSYVIQALDLRKNNLKSIAVLKDLKTAFSKYIETLDIEKINIKSDALNDLQDRGQVEIFWIQFLMILKFWMDDTSKSFEKSDIFIEKSINAGFDLIDTKPLKSIFDLGKFLFKEKIK